MNKPSGIDVKKDLRGNISIKFIASHFTLGQSPLSYESEFRYAYKPYKVDIEKNPHLATLIRQSHFTLGTSSENPYTSVYESTLKPHDLKEAYVAPAPNKNFISSFKIGLNDQNLYMTESQLMYKKPPADAYKVDSDLKASIRFIKGSHFDLGGGGKGDGVAGGYGAGAGGDGAGAGGAGAGDGAGAGAKHFVTLNELTYQYRPAEMVKPNTSIKADLRKSHFGIGIAQHEPMITTNQCTYTDKSKESDNKKAKPMALRQSHFTLGDGKGEYTTTHLLNYRDPKLV